MQLHNYGFSATQRKTVSRHRAGYLEYGHENFQRDKKDLLFEIKIVRKQLRNRRKSHLQAQHAQREAEMGAAAGMGFMGHHGFMGHPGDGRLMPSPAPGGYGVGSKRPYSEMGPGGFDPHGGHGPPGHMMHPAHMHSDAAMHTNVLLNQLQHSMTQSSFGGNQYQQFQQLQTLRQLQHHLNSNGLPGGGAPPPGAGYGRSQFAPPGHPGMAGNPPPFPYGHHPGQGRGGAPSPPYPLRPDMDEGGGQGGFPGPGGGAYAGQMPPGMQPPHGFPPMPFPGPAGGPHAMHRHMEQMMSQMQGAPGGPGGPPPHPGAHRYESG